MPRRKPRGFTLIETLMACGILLIMVVAVTTAVSAGQQHAFHAHQRIAGTLAAEEWMGRLEALQYSQLTSMHEVEAVGTMVDSENAAFPENFANVGREAWVTPTHIELDDLDLQVNGVTIRVRAFDTEDQTLAEVSRFIAEPAVETLSEEEADDYSGEGGGGGGNGGLLGLGLLGL